MYLCLTLGRPIILPIIRNKIAKNFSTNQKLIAIPGSRWSNKELEYFRIETVNVENFEKFFQESPPKIENLSDQVKEVLSVDLSKVDVLSSIDWKNLKHVQASRVIKLILIVTRTRSTTESAVDDLAKSTLELFNYDDVGNVWIKTYAKPDMFISSHLVIKLLVQADKSHKDSNQITDAESQVIAEAIASFQRNSKVNSHLEAQLIPCITLLRTYPTFYLFKVTKMLSECVKIGNRPEEKTIVKKYDISAEIEPYLLRDAMLIQKYRQHVM
ncbi:20855_t:CDS:2, partial [Dentiscutata erythropus]